MTKFEKNYETNRNNFSNRYQIFVIDKVYEFLAKGEKELINQICEVCKCYDIR